MTGHRKRSVGLPLVAVVSILTGCDISGPFRVLTDEREVERVTITPDTITAAIRDTVRLSAKPFGRSDREITEFEIAWSTGDPSIARSLGGGRFVVVSTGTAEVFATARGRRGAARITGR